MCFFFEHKTAYEMRISDWSSDVCSSDLHAREHPQRRCTDRVVAVAGPRMLGSGAADQHVAAVAVPGQQRQQVAGGEQVRQQVFVQAPAQELLRLVDQPPALRSEEHTSELQSLMRSSYAVFCLKNKNPTNDNNYAILT